MTMTVAALHKRLGALVEAGHGRKPVMVNKATFTHPLEEDGAVILHIAEVRGPEWIPNVDDDGGTKWNRDGSESGQRVVMLTGDRERSDGAPATPPSPESPMQDAQGGKSNDQQGGV